MLDIKLIRKTPEECEARLRKKDPSISLSPILNLDKEVRKLKTDHSIFRRGTIFKVNLGSAVCCPFEMARFLLYYFVLAYKNATA